MRAWVAPQAKQHDKAADALANLAATHGLVVMRLSPSCNQCSRAVAARRRPRGPVDVGSSWGRCGVYLGRCGVDPGCICKWFGVNPGSVRFGVHLGSVSGPSGVDLASIRGRSGGPIWGRSGVHLGPVWSNGLATGAHVRSTRCRFRTKSPFQMHPNPSNRPAGPSPAEELLHVARVTVREDDAPGAGCGPATSSAACRTRARARARRAHARAARMCARASCPV